MRKPLPDCKYNKMVGCEDRKCDSCGWNPKVDKERKKRAAEKELTGKWT